MSKEVLGLSSSSSSCRAGMSKMVCASNKAHEVGTIVLLGKVWAGIASPFRSLGPRSVTNTQESEETYLDNGKASTVLFRLGPVDITLPPRNITTFRIRSLLEAGRTGAHESEECNNDSGVLHNGVGLESMHKFYLEAAGRMLRIRRCAETLSLMQFDSRTFCLFLYLFKPAHSMTIISFRSSIHP